MVQRTKAEVTEGSDTATFWLRLPLTVQQYSCQLEALHASFINDKMEYRLGVNVKREEDSRYTHFFYVGIFQNKINKDIRKHNHIPAHKY